MQVFGNKLQLFCNLTFYVYMKIDLKLHLSKGDKGNGFPLVVSFSNKGVRKQKLIGYSKVEHFNDEMQLINELHPDYDDLLPRLMAYKLKARRIMAKGVSTIDEAMEQLFSDELTDGGNSFIEWCDRYLKELRASAQLAEKRKDLVSRNRIMGNVEANQTALNLFRNLYPAMSFEDMQYSVMMRFRKFREMEGNSKATIQNYLRQLRAMYNKGIREYSLPDNRPFDKVFDGLKVRSFDVKKKYITIDDIRAIENFKPKSEQIEKYKDLFLLQFYFGGCDLTDIYFMKRNVVNKGRVILERGKTGQMVDLKIHSKAQAILDKYAMKTGEYLFPWDKEVTKYETFRRRLQRYLVEFQKELEIVVQPMDGNLGIKVARHTFGNRAKQLFIDPDVIRELMGHERNEIDNFYKDKFSKTIRDEALFKIIDTE